MNHYWSRKIDCELKTIIFVVINWKMWKFIINYMSTRLTIIIVQSSFGTSYKCEWITQSSRSSQLKTHGPYTLNVLFQLFMYLIVFTLLWRKHTLIAQLNYVTIRCGISLSMQFYRCWTNHALLKRDSNGGFGSRCVFNDEMETKYKQ